MSKKAGIIFITLGAVLILSALLLSFHNQREAEIAGQEAESLLADMQSRIESRVIQPTRLSPETETAEQTEETLTQPTLDPEMPVEYINGYDYIGYLEIPILELTLPVMAQWDYSRLRYAPCRQFGSTRTDDLVVAAHNYSTHFGLLKNLNPGDEIFFTDMEGIENAYRVAQVNTVDPYDVETVMNSDYPLVLYTCTIGGASRVTVMCSRVT